MAVNTLDDLGREGYDKAETAIEKFRKSKRSRNDETVLYDALVNLGLSDESADEYVNLEVENN